MWNRRELKAKGKAAFKANYWRSVLVALLILVVLGSGATAARSGSHASMESGSEVADLDTPVNRIDDLFADLPDEVAIVVAIVVVIAVLVSIVIFVLIDVLLLNPLEVGCKRFFTVNSREPAGLGELGYGFENHYGNVVGTSFRRDVYLVLWSLLFVIPGIIKSYSYRLVPYILADNPELKSKEVITLSRQMMKGNKWRSFVLDLSFIGWDFLSAITLGLVGIFYSNPYQAATEAELYKAIRDAQ